MSDTLKRGHIRETQTLQGVNADYTYFTPKQGYKLIHAEESTWSGKRAISLSNAASVIIWNETIPTGTTLVANLYFMKL